MRTLSPIAFVKKEEMSQNINAMKILNDISIFMLKYADDTVRFANSEMELPKLFAVSDYCNKRTIDVNSDFKKRCI